MKQLEKLKNDYLKLTLEVFFKNMNNAEKYILWTSKKRSSYFLIPNYAVLPNGDYVIRQIQGIEKQVAPKALIPYEISAKDAEPYMQQEIAQVMNQVSSLFSDIVGITIQNSKHIALLSLSPEQTLKALHQ
ncbi:MULTISPECIES: hypothetical protein [unclassified Coleofasciculus]|uniref:hypothetical protein n=1 Tax=unclassified Coleofasciculus TaxID=2692782 RepID=UPI001882BC68|nr:MULTISPECIES: hypothetical protein [unclassified Coleofasciculus]MBE9129645.1 hypothetical protein [Coleofasciculus sp. LEGE 07081]MBE9152167.1 hypothetical protein [Coleofasciculus sp. LEGE 07092]